MRSVRYVLWIVMQGVLAMLGMAALYMLFSALTMSPESAAESGQVMAGTLTLLGVLFPCLLEMNLVPVHLPIALSMGATRREGFWGFGAAKPAFMIGTGAILVVAQAAAQKYFGSAPLLTGTRLVRVLALYFISAAVGELFGVLGLRFGGKLLMGLSLAMGAMCGIMGGSIGFVIAREEAGSALTLLLRVLDGLPAAVPAACAAAVIGPAAGWLLCRRIPVR